MANIDTNPQTEINEQQPSIDSGAPVPVAVEYVEAQLIELWRDVAEAAQAKGGVQAVTMAQVLNLIIRADSYADANRYIKDVDFITGRHPCRVIVTTTDPSEQNMPVQAWVSIHCQLPPTGGRQVCCEQVSVAAGGESVRQISAAIIPLLLPDLPVFLWWPQGAPFDEYVFRNLTDSLNRLIIDSSTFENPEGTLSKMAGRLKSNWSHVACTDMNWGRLTPWRDMVAQFFDGQAMRPYLDRIGNVTIDFALSERGGVNRAQALMLAGWLASRLGWQPADNMYQLVRGDGHRPAVARLSMRSGKRTITITLNPDTSSSNVVGDICGIKLEVPGESSEGKPEASFEVSLADDEHDCAWTCVDIQGANPTKRNIQMETLSEAELLDAELEVFSYDKVYEEALAMVGVFIRGTADTAKTTGEPRKVGEFVSAGAQRTRPQGPPPR